MASEMYKVSEPRVGAATLRPFPFFMPLFTGVAWKG